MSDAEAHAKFVAIRFAANDGEPFCPHCGNLNIYTLTETPPRWKCAGCRREILGDRPDIRVVGDRFVFQAEVLFPPGSAELSDNAKKELEPLIAALKEIAAKIPPDINWILQIEDIPIAVL